MDPHAPLLAQLAARRDEMLGEVRAWSAVNSGSRHLAGLHRMSEELASAFAELAPVERIELSPQLSIDSHGQPQQQALGVLLRLRKRPEAPWQVLLVGHYDTVFGVDHPFQEPRWNADGTLNGPGVADLKGGLVVMLHALRALEASPQREQVGWTVLLNPDEEIGSPGSAAHLAAAAREHHLGLVFEPALADGTLAGARKGSGNFTLVVRGRTAHAGRNPQEGRNAVLTAARLATQLADLGGGRAGVTVNPAAIDGGSAVNVVPDLAILRFNVRVGSVEEQHWFESECARIVDAVATHDEVSIERHGGFSRPPKTLDARQLALYQLVRDCGTQLGLELHWQPTGGCCDGNNLAAAGLPNVDTLGVRGGAIHSDREFLVVDSLVERARLSALLLLRLAAGEIDPSSFQRPEVPCC